MIDYIKNLLPRLQQYSSSLDHKEIFVEQPWILIDGNGTRHNYIFERNGNLIVSINGNVTTGNWKYIAASKALLIETSTQKLLLRHAFVDNGLMFLKLDGSPDKPWVFANENLIPDLDIQRYLLNVLIKNMQLTHCTINGKAAFYKEEDGFNIYYDEDLKHLNTEIKHADGKNAIIRNGRVVRTFYTEVYSSDKGRIYVEQRSASKVNVDDVVYMNGVKAPDGIYKISKKCAWIISSGKIIEIKSKTNIHTILTLVIICVTLGSLFYFDFTSKIKTPEQPIITRTDSIISPSFSVQDFKDEIIKRFDYVASKDFNGAAEIYSDTVNNYYGKRDVNKAYVTQKLTDYWGKHVGTFLQLDTSSLMVVQNSDTTNITCNATDWYEDKDSKIPMIYELGYSFTLNKYRKIIEEHAKINSQVIDSLKLLHLPNNSSLAELRSSGNSEYLNAIFNDLNSDLFGSDYKDEIKWVLVTSLGEGVNVYTQDGDANSVMNIRLFTNNLILKQMLFNKVLNFIMDASGRITGIVIELWNYPATVTDSMQN